MTLDMLFENNDLHMSIIAIGIFLVFLLLRKVFSKYLFKLILKISKQTPTEFFTNIWLSFEHPIRWLFVIIGFYAAAAYFPYINHKNEMFLNFFRSAIIILLTWGLFNLSSASSAIFQNLNKRLNLDIDQILIPFLSKMLRAIIVIIGISVILVEFDYNISGLITGLGLGGLAISLAAQDAIKNFIGGIVIIFENALSLGHWITTPSVEGTVEDISFRSTKIRTFDQALVLFRMLHWPVRI